MRDDLDGSKLRTRVKGRSNIERALHQLHRRVYRYATCRTLTPQDYKWALDVASALQVLLTHADGEQVRTTDPRP